MGIRLASTILAERVSRFRCMAKYRSRQCGICRTGSHPPLCNGWSQGALPMSRRPRAQRPRCRSILVLVPVSSKKTSLLASRPGCSAFHVCCASATSGRSCSAARSVLFEADPVPLEDRRIKVSVVINPRPSDIRSSRFHQGQVWSPSPQAFKSQSALSSSGERLLPPRGLGLTLPVSSYSPTRRIADDTPAR